jgi:hypothetical protein
MLRLLLWLALALLLKVCLLTKQASCAMKITV